MTYDIATMVSNNQSLVGLALANSTSSIKIISDLNSALPLSLAGRDIGSGADLAFRVFVNQAFDGGVSSLAVSVVMATDEALTVGTFLSTTTIPLVGLVQGNEFDVRIPSLSEAQAVGVSYLGLFYLPSATPTTGAISAWIPLGHSPRFPRRLRANYTGP